MKPDDWIDTVELIARLPAPSATLRRIVSMRREGRRDFPTSIPVAQAVALAAAAQAHARGVKRTQRVFDDVRVLGPRQLDFVVVLSGGRPPRFALAEGFQPIPAVVLDLRELHDAVLSGSAIPH